MVRLRFATLGAMVACAVVGAPATAQAAHEFTGPGAPQEARAVAVGAQQFVFRPFRIMCEGANSVKTEIAAPWPSATLALQMRYSKCNAHAGKVGKTEGPAIPTHFLSPLSLTYYANGFVEVGTVEIAVGGEFKCKIEAEPQTIPTRAVKRPLEEFTAAAFVNEEVVTSSKKMPIQHEVLVKNAAVKAIHYTLTEGFCEELEMPEGKGGSYTGELKAEVKKANLSWK
ncbi:MAG TPA: hypothetical protein VKG82_01825 [Solirubrobacteraceae bacterium]|nr:hypothetical protein [Solirubrobacteraceae bacterium]